MKQHPKLNLKISEKIVNYLLANEKDLTEKEFISKFTLHAAVLVGFKKNPSSQ